MKIVYSNGREVLKLADIGLAKSDTGSPVSMAPEVLLQIDIDNCKSDIYSLAIVMWEIWYGVDAVTYMESMIKGNVDPYKEEGLRPSMLLEQKPPPDWEVLIKRCWDQDPIKRPEVEDVLNFFYCFVYKHFSLMKIQKKKMDKSNLSCSAFFTEKKYY